MPGMDGTGPMGAGPMSGGARGYCNPAGVGYRPGFGQGFGYGRGFGRGRGFGAGFGAGYGRGRGYGRGLGWRGAYPPAGRWYYGQAPYGDTYAMNPEDEVSMLKGDAEAMKRDLDAIHKRIEELKSESSEA